MAANWIQSSSFWSVLLILGLIPLCWSADANQEQSWPPGPRENIYIPPLAKDIQYKPFDGWFTVSYRGDICYPAKSTIQAMALSMKSRGWDRLIYDPLNPGTQLPPEFPEDHIWSYYPWNSYWRDNSGNVIRYEYSYEVADTPSFPEYFEAIRKSCSLKAVAIYFSSDAFERMLKVAKESREKMDLITDGYVARELYSLHEDGATFRLWEF